MGIESLKSEYKEHYQIEGSRRIELNSAIDKPIGIISVYFGMIYFLFSNITQPWSVVEFIQITFIIITICIMLYSIIYLIKSYLGNTYAILATPVQNEVFRKELVEYYEGKSKKAEAEAEAEVIDAIYASYIVAAHQNALLNDRRSSFLYRTKEAIVWAFPVIMVIGIIQIVSKIEFAPFIEYFCNAIN